MKLLTEGLNSELQNTNVRVTVVFPGATKTNITANSGLGALPASEQEQSKIKMLAPDKAAEIIVEGIEQDRYRVLVGSDSRLMDFIYRLNPNYAAGFIYKQMKSLLGD